MPVLALCEKGLILDVFGEKPRIFGCESYKLNNNKLVFNFNSKLKFLNDLTDLNKIEEAQINGFSEMAQSKDGEKVVVLCGNKNLKIFNNSILINEIDLKNDQKTDLPTKPEENVSNSERPLDSKVECFGISNQFYCYATKDEIKIFNFESSTAIFQMNVAVKTIHCLDGTILFVSDKIILENAESVQRVMLFKDGKLYRLMEHQQIFRTVVESKDNMILLLADTHYTGKSYYADSVLYLIKFDDLSTLANTYSIGTKDQELISLNEIFGIISFSTLKKVHSFGFFNQTIFVCFGDQPAFVHFYSHSGIFQSKLPKALRNKVVFNKSGKRVINAGFGNLPGNIEVFENGESVCYFESLGASSIAWLNDNSRFILSTTNYFKSDNKVCIYDYYGRLLEIMECKSLVSAEVYGCTENEIPITKPETILKQKVAQAYVPPHLSGVSSSYVIPLVIKKDKKLKKVETVKNVATKKESVRTFNDVQNELDACISLQEKMKAGEELSLDDQNKVFKIKKLKEELEQLKKD
jgi:hypothetical protein